jgi:hypothetical protein
MAHWRCLSIALLIGRAVFAATYPVSANLVLAPRSAQSCLQLSRESDCAAAPIARDAFARAVIRMFTPSGPGNLRLELSIKSVEVTGIQLDLYVRVQVRAPDGQLIEELVAFGGAPALDRSPDTLHRAEVAAAEVAALDFERLYSNASSVGEYLVSNKAGPAETLRVPVRSDKLVTLAASVGIVEGGGDDAFAVAPGLRVAVSLGRGFAQVAYSHYSSSFTGGQTQGIVQPFGASLATNDLGLELGAVFRPTKALELRAGPGVHFLFGDASFDQDAATLPSSFSKIAPVLYGSIATSFLAGRKGPRFSFGLEARGYFFTTADLPQLLRTVPVANLSAAVFLALELPWDSQPETAR